MRKDPQAVLESLAQNRRHPRNIEQWLVSPANTIKSSTLHSRPPAKKKRGIEQAPQKAACTALNWLLINHCTVFYLLKLAYWGFILELGISIRGYLEMPPVLYTVGF